MVTEVGLGYVVGANVSNLVLQDLGSVWLPSGLFLFLSHFLVPSPLFTFLEVKIPPVHSRVKKVTKMVLCWSQVISSDQ